MANELYSNFLDLIFIGDYDGNYAQKVGRILSRRSPAWHRPLSTKAHAYGYVLYMASGCSLFDPLIFT